MCSRAGDDDDDVTHQRRAVLWDIDGTLVDSTDLAWSSTNLVLKQNGFPGVSSEEYKEATRLTTPKRLALHATKDMNAEIGIKLAEEFDQHYVQLVSPTTVPLFPGLQELLEDLSKDGILLGALSNACGAYVRAVLSCHGWADAFRTHLGADDVTEAKPAPGGLLKCCDLLGVTPSQVCYVGDSPGDGKAAKAAGLYSVGVRWGGAAEADLLANFDKVELLLTLICLRYGLALSNDQVSDFELKGMWKALDENKSSTVTVGAFMVFMRRYGTPPAHNTSKQKLQSNHMSTMSEEEEWKQMLAEAPALDANHLMSIATALTLGIHSWLNKSGAEKSTTHLWPKFIEAANGSNRQNRLKYGDFRKTIAKACLTVQRVAGQVATQQQFLT
eukprot:symbB.v1.2.012171.t5/scaffold832.1/size159137/16